MKLFTAKTGYLVFALISIVFSILGFAGLLESKVPDAPASVHLGIMFLFGGVFLLYCFFQTGRKK